MVCRRQGAELRALAGSNVAALLTAAGLADLVVKEQVED